jgi:xanthine dehydrogenase/oxidase
LEGIATIEYIMEHIAHVVKRDPIEVRFVNLPTISPVRKMINTVRKSSEFDVRSEIVSTFNKVRIKLI